MAAAAGLPVGGTNSATTADASCISVRAATPDALSAATSGRAATGEELLAGAAGLSIGGTTGSLTGATTLPRLPIGGTNSAGGTKRLAALSPRDEADSDSESDEISEAGPDPEALDPSRFALEARDRDGPAALAAPAAVCRVCLWFCPFGCAAAALEVGRSTTSSNVSDPSSSFRGWRANCFWPGRKGELQRSQCSSNVATDNDVHGTCLTTQSEHCLPASRANWARRNANS